MTSHPTNWIHVDRRIPEYWSKELTDADFGVVNGWEEDGRRPGLATMTGVRSRIQEDLDMGFVPREALHRAITGRNLDGNPVDRREDQALLAHYLAARDGVAKSMGGLPSIAPREMRDYYRSYIDGVLVAMDNQFRDSFFGRAGSEPARTWVGADALGPLNNQARHRAKATLNDRDFKAHLEGFKRGVKYQPKIRAGYTRRSIPGWDSPRGPNALTPLEAPFQMLYEDLHRDGE